MNDMAPVIIPRSDQINADDLLSSPMTIKITGVKVSPGSEQPVSIGFEGSDKVYRCCKSMARVLVNAWGPDSSKYAGRSLTLYCDPKVKWGGMDVGGIRISHMSDIDSALTMALTVTRANKKPFTVKPLETVSAPTLKQVLAAIKSMSDKSSRDAAKTMMGSLNSEDDVATAVAAYQARIAALKAPVTDPFVAEMEQAEKGAI